MREFVYCVLLLVIVHLSAGRMPATFKASMCYDPTGEASVRLRCPPGFNIETLTSFTGISRYSACSYMAWDCVIQEGATGDRCDGQSRCSVSVTYTEEQSAALSCGEHDETKYFQIEYECRTGDGSQAVVLEPSLEGPPQAPASPTQHVVVTSTDSPSDERGIDNQFGKRAIESKVTLVAIVCGSAIAMIFVVVVMATLAHRIKKRIYDNSSVYGPLGTVRSRAARGSPLYSSYVGSSRLSLEQGLDSPRTSMSHLALHPDHPDHPDHAPQDPIHDALPPELPRPRTVVFDSQERDRSVFDSPVLQGRSVYDSLGRDRPVRHV